MAQPQGPPSSLKPWTSTSPRRYRLVNASLIDPKDGQIYTHVTLDLQDGLISKMTKLGSKSAAAASAETLGWTQGVENITTVDLAGKFVLPGLIDCHVHLACPPGESGVQETLTPDASTSLLRQPYVAREMLRRGFTSVRDCGGAGLALKEAFEEGLFPGPRLFIAGHAISQTGGHGDFRGPKSAEYSCCGGNTLGLGRIADGVEQCLHAAREELRQGADYIKIMVSGGVVSPTDRLHNLQYTPAEIQAFTKVAADAGTYVTAHAYTPAAIRNAVESGVKGIEHGNFLDEPTAKLMAEKGVFLTPTLITYQAMGSSGIRSYLPPDIAAKNLEVLRHGLQALRIAEQAGVTLCYGTDLLGLLHAKQSGEFALRRQAGLSTLAIIQSATVNAAKMLNAEDRLGRVKEGFCADLLVLNANPLADISVLERPDRHLLAVFKGGRVLESRWSVLPREDAVPKAMIE